MIITVFRLYYIFPREVRKRECVCGIGFSISISAHEKKKKKGDGVNNLSGTL